MGSRASKTLQIMSVGVLLLCTAGLGQNLDDKCTVSVLNRTVRVNADGSWVLPNIPASFGQVKARATCVRDGVTTSGESAFFTVQANGAVNLPAIVLGSATQVPASLSITPANPSLTAAGQTTQLLVTATYPDISTANVTAGATGTNYTTSNSAIATVSANGLITAVGSGTVLIQATNDGASGIVTASVVLSNVDSDNDGIPDDVEITLGLDPHNAVDAQEDFDRDGLTNLREFQLGTGLRVFDTDGDGIGDGLEVQTGSNPVDPNSFNFAQTLQSIQATPTNIVLVVNTIIGEASQQLAVTGRLVDGNVVNLTARSRGTNYNSSNLSVANFGAVDGMVFAGINGAATITVTNNGFTAPPVQVNVSSFAPTALSALSIPGYANNVDVSGDFAYVAAGATGLQVVSISNRRTPAIVGSLDTPGNANDVRIVGNRAYVADGSAGLRIIDVTNPLSPTLIGSVDTPGEAQDVVVSGTRAYIADGVSGLQIVDVSNPSAPIVVGSVDTPGTAKGVDVSGNFAVVADGSPSSAVRIINITNPASPQIVGNLAIPGDAKDLVVRNTEAYVAAFTGGLQIVDFSTATSPRIMGGLPGSSPNGFVPRDVELSGRFALAAEQLFPNAVPIVDVANPATPLLRTVLNFAPLGDYAGTGIALDANHVYMTGEFFIVGPENGTTGNTRLFIGQYLALEDRAGIPPTVSITSPSAGSTVIEGTTLHLSAVATDDVQVVSVDFLVNGSVVFTDSVAPYQFDVTVPVGAPILTVGARATDLGGNLGVAQNVQVNVIPDPKTTVIGRVLDPNSNPVQGANVVTNGGLTATTGVDGFFSIPGTPTILGNIFATATANVGGVQLSGSSASFAPVAGGQTNVGDVIIRPGRLFGVTFNGPSGPSTLHSIDHLTGVATLIGPIGFNAVSAMDFDSAGVLYAIGRRPSDSVSVLLTINTATGAGTAIGPTGVENLGFGDSVSDLSFRNSDGVLYAYLEAGDGLGTVNKLTGAITALGRSFVSCCGNGLEFSPGDVLFHSNDSELHTLNQTTGLATLVAPMVFPVPDVDFPRINAMDYQPGTGVLYGSLLKGTGSSRVSYLVTVNTTNGVVTIVGQTVTLLDAIAFR
ncbi:MAG TPA: Ig-like domain-containing protein [Blastocatellia bacterium]|nr:Ig-like domain-containing protein [Blastocatellia bacterium]